MRLKLLFVAIVLFVGVGSSYGQASLPLNRTAWASPPTGWTDNGVQRTTIFACSGSDGGSMQATGKYYKVWFSGVPYQLSYSIKGSNPSSGTFNVQESSDGISWTNVISYSTVSGATCINEVKPLLTSSRYVQFIYTTKTTGNIDIDDVSISASSGPTIDGVITIGEYGTHTDGNNQQTSGASTTYLSWDATNLYVGVNAANTAEAFVLYLDKDPQALVNGGTNANGTNVGINYDGTSFAELPYRADLVLYVKNGYREYRTADGSNGWSGATSGFGSYAETSGTVREFSIPWSAIGGMPTSFNHFSYVTSSGGYVYGQTPTENAGGNIGTSARYSRYYTVSTTTVGSATPPFSRNSFVFNSASDVASFGAISAYDFTMNTSGRYLSRTGSTLGDWTIAGNLTVGNGAVYLGSGGGSYGTTAVIGNLNLLGGTFDMDQTNAAVSITGNVDIASGANLKLSGSSGGDLNLAGNWINSGTFTPNGRAITFNGTGNQTITNASGETFNYLINNKTTGTLTLANNVTVNANSGSPLQLLNTGGFDLNGKSLTLSGAGGDIQVTGGARTIGSGLVGATLNIAGYKNVSGTGTLILDTNVTTILNNGFNCGTGNKTTINGILQINGSGYIDTNAPIYGNASLLKYSSGGVYERRIEWNRNIGASFGVPKDVLITNNTILNYPFGTPGALGMTGNLTIDSGSSLFMDYGSTSSAGALTVAGNLVSSGNMTLGTAIGDDLKIGGNITFNSGYNFDAKGRAVIFTKAGTQIITASSKPTFSYVNLTSGATIVQLSGTDMDITAPYAGNVISFSGAGDTFDLNGRTLTLGTAGVDNVINGSGTFKGSTTSNLTLLGTGSLGTLKFASDLNIGTLTMNRQAATVGCTMGSAVTINTALNLTNGLISLGNFDLSLGLTATNSGSANGFVISDPDVGTGMLTKRVNSLGAYTLHIGENTAPDGTQYAPATINFTSIGSFSPQAYYGVQVKDAIHPNIDSPIDSLSKYWIITSSGTFDTPVYSFTGTYTSGTADVNGTESNCISAKWDGSKWTNGVAIAGGTLSISGLTSMTTTNEISAGNRNREINIKGLTGGTNNIDSGSITANGLNNTLFAATNIGSSATKDYEIQNLGIAALNLTGTPIVSIGGANPGDFTVTTVPSSTAIVGGASTTFIITFSPTYSGTRTAIVSVANNDSDESPYTFLIQGTGTCNPIATNTITPTSGPVGTEVTINATTNNLTGATATFNGVTATIVSSTATKLVVLVPAGAISGNLITTNATGCQATNTFTVVDNKANTCQGGNTASDLFISEVTDATTGGLTYVEIYNGTSSSINMNGYSLKTYSNGDTTPPTTLALTNYVLNPGSIFVVAIGTVASPDTSNTCSITGGNGSLANQSSTGSGINFDTAENDYIGLYKNSTTSIIDSFGTFGSATWADGLGLGDRGATFRRKNTASLAQPITYSNSDWNITDWVGSAQSSCYTNDYSDIGAYNFLSGTPPTVTLHPSYTPTCKATSLTVAGTEGYAGGNSLTYKWLYSVPNTTGWSEISDGTNYTGSSTATLSIADISGLIDYQYYCQIRENIATCYTASKAVKITDGGTTTWITPGTWTNGIPTLDKLVIINADYNTTTNGDLNACTLVVNAGATLKVTTQKFATIRNDLTVNLNGNLEVLDKGSLVMINDSGTVTNSGTTYIHRQTTPFEPKDYTYWSTPIVSTDIETTFTNLPSFPTTWNTENAYEFLPANYVDANNDGFDDDHNDWSFATNMTPGKGYIIMVPERQQITDPVITQATVVFSGKVNNGIKTTPIALTPDATDPDDDFNLVGNPYPSAISADAFINANLSTNGTAYNTIEGTLYFWTHKKDLSTTNLGPDAYNYSQDDYVMYNLTGGIGTGGLSTDADAPKGYIASGQGFFVEAVNTGTLIFNNAMRVGLPATANSQFYKTRSGKSKIVTKDRIWLNLENSVGMFSQQLVGYFDNATLGYDNGYDGLLNDGGNYVNFYSFIDDKTYKIQGRSTFDENDQVRLGYFSAVAGTFNINIDSKEGVFNNLSTEVYIEDKLLNVIHNLKTNPYIFTTEKGTFNDRFVLRYTNKTLSNNDFESFENQVLVSSKNKQIKVNSVVETIDKVTIYDLLGRQLFKKEKVNSNELVISNIVSSQQTLLVKISLQNGQTVTKKLVY